MYKKYFVILHLPNNKGVRQTMRKYLKWLLPVIFNGGPCHHHASLSEIQLFHILTTLSVEDGAVHALHLNFNAQQVAEIVEYPVYPDYKLPDKGLLSLRAPPVF